MASTSSIAGSIPIPFAATYSAGKHYVDFMMWALREELGQHGVDVCSWQAATVSTKMTNYSRGPLAVTPASYARQSLQKCTSVAHSGAFSHDLIYAFLRGLCDILPENVLLAVAGNGGRKAGQRVKERM